MATTNTTEIERLPALDLTIYDRAILVACPQCGAEPGVECDAPRKRKRWEQLGAHDRERHMVLHVGRQDRALRWDAVLFARQDREALAL
jgi:hypothetical protein